MSDDTDQIIRQVIKNTPVQEWTVPKLIGISGRMEHGKDTIAAMLAAKFGHVNIAFAQHLRQVCNVMFAIPHAYLTDKKLKAVPIVRYGSEGFSLPFDMRDPESVQMHLNNVLAYAYMVPPAVFQFADSQIANASLPTVGANKLNPAALKRQFVTLFIKHFHVPLMNGKVFTGREIMQLVGTDVFRAMDSAIWTWAWERRVRQHALVCAADMRFPNEFGQIGALNGVRIKVVRPNYVSSTQVNMSHISETALDDHSFDATIVNDGSIKDLWLNLSTSLTKLAKANPKAVDAGYAKVLTV